MARIRTAAVAAGLLCGAALASPAAAQTPPAARAIVFRFTPTARTQIALWIEKPDGTFLATVGLTQAVSVRGIGNRPGATQMNSGFDWPYGRREGVLPIWAHRRAAAPGAGQFPRVIFQARSEGFASRSCEDSTPDMYFCLAFRGNANKDGLDAISCPSTFNSDKGRILSQRDVMNQYAEPATIDGQQVMLPLSLVSLYPPRRDAKPCQRDAGPYLACGQRTCNDYVDVAGYDGVTDYPGADTVSGATPQRGWGYVDAARRAMPDIDAVTMATPAADQGAEIMFSIQDDWAQGDYVAWLEVNTEGDYNGTYSDVTFPTPLGLGWDGYATGTGYPYRGQPSVVYSVPFTLGASGTLQTAEPVGYGSVDGLEPDANTMHPMDGTITDDPVNSPGSGADRLRMPPGASYRLQVEVRDQDFCNSHSPPAAPTEITAAAVADPKHSHQWGHLHFIAPDSSLPIARYDVRTSTTPFDPGDPASFVKGLPASSTAIASEALMVPITGAAGSAVDVDFGGLSPSTSYFVGVRAVDGCNQVGPIAVAELKTTRVDYTKLSGCFIATAAWGSALAPEVSALRQARDRLRQASGLFAVAAELYYRSGPAAAQVLGHSETARALVRRLLGPVGAVALAQPDLVSRGQPSR